MRPVLNSYMPRALRRGIAACLAIAVFAGSGGAALVGQACMHHGGPVADAAHAAAETQTPLEGSGSHDQHGHTAARAADHQPAESHDASACTCLGACQTAATAATPGTPDVARVPAPVDVVDAIAPTDVALRSSQAAWFLPPSNGPPALT